MEKIMKRMFFTLSMLYLSTGVTPVQAFQIPSLGSCTELLTKYCPKGATCATACLAIAFIAPFVKKIAKTLAEGRENRTLIERLESQPSAEQRRLFGQICIKMGMDPTKIILLQSQTLPSGTLGGLNPIVVLGYDSQNISSEELSFIMAHELAHIKNNDSINGAKIQFSCAGIAGLSAIFVAKKIVDLQKNILVKMLAASCYSYLSYRLFGSLESYLTRRMEKRADITAVKTLKNKNGAVKYFKHHMALNLALSDRLPKGAVDRVGNYLLDPEHPLLTERIAYCESCPL